MKKYCLFIVFCLSMFSLNISFADGSLDKPNIDIEKKYKSFMEARFWHPFLKDCKKCHDVWKTKDYNSKIKKCIDCHPFLDFYNKKIMSVHPTFVEGACMKCHSPHSSDFQFLLLTKEPKLCNNCHPASEREKYAHLKVKSFSDGCLRCHEPHMSKSIYLLKP